MAWTQVANNAKTTLSAGCTDIATAITPTAKTGFPDPEDDGSFYATLWDADTYPDPGDDPGMEIVLVTADAAANWTVTRAQAGTAGAAHVAGDAVRLLWLAQHATEMQDAIDLNSTHRTDVDAVTGLLLGDGAGAYAAATATDLPLHAAEHESGGGDEVSHDSLTDYDAAEHYAQTAITNVSSALASGLLAVTTGTGALSSVETTGSVQLGKIGLGAAAGTARLTLLAATDAAGGIDLGGDVTLYRKAANVLKTDDTLVSALNIGVNTDAPAPPYGSDRCIQVTGAASPGFVLDDTGQTSKWGWYALGTDRCDFRYGNAAGPVLTLDGTNTRVGVNTATPTVPLEVVGAAKISGNIEASSGMALGENASIQLDSALSADGKYTGIVRAGVAGATLAFGDLIYLDPTDSRWELADANSAAAADGDARGLIGICVLAAAGDGSATTVLLWGNVRADTAFPALSVGQPVYASETAGDVVVAAPSTSGAVVRTLGFGLTADAMLFAPSSDYIELA